MKKNNRKISKWDIMYWLTALVPFIISVCFALMFVAAGNYLPKCRQNYTMGIKLPWTLADEDNWNRTHRMAGYVWTAGGILMLIMGFFHLASLFFLVFMAMVLIPSVYSMILWRRGKTCTKNPGKRLPEKIWCPCPHIQD